MANLTYHTNAGVGENTAAIYGDKGKILVGYNYLLFQKNSARSVSRLFTHWQKQN